MLKRNSPVCRACGVPIWFIQTRAGKTMPVNEQPTAFIPDEKGSRIYLTEDGVTHRGWDWQPGDAAFHEMGYVSHFATCPKAGDFR